MRLQGKLIAETPIYRGNARKTLFTRDDDGTQRLISLAGEIAGTAESLMDAFIGQSRNGRNTGLLDQLWLRLYGAAMPKGLITRVLCQLEKEIYTRDRFFDLRMGLRLDEDRWAAEANANYKMETVFRNAVFGFEMTVDDAVFKQGDNAARLAYLLRELGESRFWFGAGKSKGLGRCRLELDTPLHTPQTTPSTAQRANHLRIDLSFSAVNPVLVGWNWGKVDPSVPAFAAVEGRQLVGAMRGLSDDIRKPLEMVLSGPILNPDDWKKRLATYLPRVSAAYLRKQSLGETETWTLRSDALVKLGKGKFPLSKQVLTSLEPLVGQPFPSRAAGEAAISQTLGKKANMANRVVQELEQQRREGYHLNPAAWREVVQSLNLSSPSEQQIQAQVSEQIGDEAALTRSMAEACRPILPQIFQQIDHQIHLLQSDAWVDAEVATREEHLQIKTMLFDDKIDEPQWNNRNQPPAGVSTAAWQTFLDEHRRVRFQHITDRRNLRKSISNDRNFIAYLKAHRDRTRQELAQPYHIDFRGGGPFNREISRQHGKPYDTVFMRMLAWSPSAQERGAWEVYIPGSTIKGAFRKRATQVLRTLWGESERTNDLIDWLFGKQGQRGAILFSDAYLRDPVDMERAWCSMDGVRMDPATGAPVDAAKHDYLFAYGQHLVFRMQMDCQDLSEHNLDGLTVFSHLLRDFQAGDIPVGGEKTSGFGWVQAEIDRITWLTTNHDGVTQTLFGDRELEQDGIWQRLTLEAEEASAGLRFIAPLRAQRSAAGAPRSMQGFISHRTFGGHCGLLAVEAEVLSPLHVRESGEPSHRATVNGETVNGWDCFSMAPPEAALRPDARLYALPSRSIRGMLRHIYAIASDSSEASPDLYRLNPVDSLFGWVGSGTNQAIMARLSVGFGRFDSAEATWYKVPYPYTGWSFTAGRWEHVPGRQVPKLQIAKTWRLFPHAPLAPIAAPMGAFLPDTAQASYCKAIVSGGRARFTIRFWNLEEEELQRLIWCVVLAPDLAHKLGHHRHLGFGSLRFKLLPESYRIDWSKRYGEGQPSEWQAPIRAEEWTRPDVIAHRTELLRILNAQSL